MVASCACPLWSPRTKPSTCAMPAAAPGNMWPGPCSMCMVRGQAEGGRGAHGQPREASSPGSVCRGQRAQGPGESREDPSARRPHGQAVLPGGRCAQCHHHLAEGRGQPPHTGEGIHPCHAHRLQRVPAFAIRPSRLYFLPHRCLFWLLSLPTGWPGSMPLWCPALCLPLPFPPLPTLAG